MTTEQKEEFFARLERLVEDTKQSEEKARVLSDRSLERAKASHITFQKFMEDRRRQEGGAEQPPAGN